MMGRWAAAVGLGCVLGWSSPALAEPPERIQMMEIVAFDDVFVRVDEIDGKLRGAEKALHQSKRALAEALELPKDTPIGKALDELADRGAGSVEVVVGDEAPQLIAAGAVGSDVAAAIAATNEMVEALTQALADLGDVQMQTQRLVDSTRAFPSTLRQEFTSEAGFFESLFGLPKASKMLRGNLEVTSGLPDRSATVVGRLHNILGMVSNEFTPAK
jgi:hypothetical protein